MIRQNDHVGNTDILSYENWAETLRSLCGNFQAYGVDRKAFSGWILPQQICGFGAANIGWNAERVERTERNARRDGVDHFSAIFQLVGESVVCRQDRVDKLSPGDIALVDSARAVKYVREGKPGSRFGMNFPRQAVISHLGREPSVGMRKHGETLAVRLFFQLIRDTGTRGASDLPSEDPYEQMVIYDLLGSLFGPHDPLPISQHADKLFKRICAIIGSSFTNPDIGPFEVASEAGISLRYLQKLFANRGMTCGQYIQAVRLECAMRLLRRRRSMNIRQPVSEIAYSSGFRDYRYFARAFRGRFGCSPDRAGEQM